jgi:uncharacterized membrane protein YphA (DoxX/SURF4 family)
MPHNPITDTFHFLIGSAGDYGPFGNVRYVSVLFYLTVISGSFYIAYRAWRADPAQRTIKHVSIWLMRLVAAGMWYQGTLWKLPLPVSDAFRFWDGALAKFSAFPLHAAIAHAVFVPYIAVVQPLVYLTEIFFTVTLSLGLFVRFSALLAVAFTVNLWIGLYNDPTEWPWTYAAIIFANGMFVTSEAGRSLGLDFFLRRNPPRLAKTTSLPARAFWLAT